MPSADSVTAPRYGRVRWRRFAIVMVPAALVAAVLIGLTAKGAVAASFAVSGQQFTVTANSLSGTGFEQYGSTFKEANGKEQPVAVSVIRNATLVNLCQSVKVMGVTLRITAGGGSTPVTASNLVVGATDLSGNATFHNINVGQDASTLDQAGEAGQAGTFGQQASSVSITNVHQLAWSTTAGTFKLPGFHLQVGGAPC
ncbi:MAG TPA: DUF6230 family protein [Streptosporangiaceae bacterium]|nr:DUF6230 family protein [Streptosporangiaceae bacterium]